MKDYQEIFKRWRDIPIEALSDIDDAGARVELAIRTNSPELKRQAIELMDTHAYNVLAGIWLLEKDEFKEQVQMYEPCLVPAISIGNDLDLRKEDNILLQSVKALESYASGMLGKMVAHISSLYKKIVYPGSSSYLGLLRMHFSEFDIAFLNYKWLRMQTGDSNLAKLQSNLLSVLFSKSTGFDEADKELILQVCKDHSRYTDDISWTKGFECDDVVNDDNWYWLYEQYEAGLISFNCLAVYPITNQDISRFNALKFSEKIICINKSVLRINQAADFYRMLNKINFTEYLDEINNTKDSRVFDKLIQLDIIKLDDLSEDRITEYVDGIKNKKAFDYVISHPEIQSMEIFRSYQWYSHLEDFYKSFLSADDNRKLIEVYLNTAYNVSDNNFLSCLSETLQHEEVVNLYDNTIIRDIVLYLVETFKNDYSPYILKRIIKNCLPADEADLLIAALENEEEIKRASERQKRELERDARVMETLSDCNSFEDLNEAYEQYRYNYNKKKLCALIVDVINKIGASWGFSDVYVKLNYEMWQEGAIDFEAFQNAVALRNEVIA